ncbi:MAG: hypothetical protein KAI70_01350 [Candidatus Omnitrophica bacterium]|nr:hypothetical protein [Candidatus Omnitrophota bacterium]
MNKKNFIVTIMCVGILVTAFGIIAVAQEQDVGEYAYLLDTVSRDPEILKEEGLQYDVPSDNIEGYVRGMRGFNQRYLQEKISADRYIALKRELIERMKR